jgi:hypothetical protein
MICPRPPPIAGLARRGKAGGVERSPIYYFSQKDEL